MKKLIFIIAGTIFLATGCGSGGSGSSGSTLQKSSVGFINPSTPLQKAINNSLLAKPEYISLNLYNSIYLVPHTVYKYQLEDMHNSLIEQGEFTCRDMSSCILKLNKLENIDNVTPYNLMIYTAAGKTFVGATAFILQKDTSYYSLVVDDLSTEEYLSTQMLVNLQNPFNIINIQQQLFKSVMKSNNKLSISELIYANFIYLTKDKGFSVKDAVNYMRVQYQNCENGDCQLDADFTKNDVKLNQIINSIQENIVGYAKDKDDSQLYSAYLWLKSSPIQSIAGGMGGAASLFYPGISGKAIESGVGSAIDAMGKLFNDNAIFAGNKAAYDRIQLISNNVSAIYSQTPDYLQSISKILGLGLQFGITSAYDTSIRNIAQDYNLTNTELVMTNKEIGRVRYESFGYFINYHQQSGSTDKSAVFDWIIGDKGLWSIKAVKQRDEDISFVTNSTNLDVLAGAYKEIIFGATDPKVLTGDMNNIEKRKLYNEVLLTYLQRSITLLQQAMFLDSLALQIRDGVIPVAHDSRFKTMYIAAVLNENGINLSRNYEDDKQKLSQFYMKKLQKLQKLFEAKMLPEKELIPELVFDTLEVKEGCKISHLDSNVLQASCPYYYEENGIKKIKYINSVLNKPASKCMTLNADGTGDMSKVAEVRFINGKLECLTTDNIRLNNIVGNLLDKNIGYTRFNDVPSLFDKSPGYSSIISNFYGAEDYFENYFKPGKVFYNSLRSGSSKIYFIPTPILADWGHTGHGAYKIVGSKSMESSTLNPPIDVGFSMDSPIVIKDKYGNTKYVIYVPVDNLKDWKIASTTGSRVDLGSIFLYSNQIATKKSSKHFVITDKNNLLEPLSLRILALYEDFPKNGIGGNKVFVPALSIGHANSVNINVKFSAPNKISNIKLIQATTSACKGKDDAYRVLGGVAARQELNISVVGTFDGDKRDTCNLVDDKTYFAIGDLKIQFDYDGQSAQCSIFDRVGTSFDTLNKYHDKLQGDIKNSFSRCNGMYSDSQFEYKIVPGTTGVFSDYSPGYIIIQNKNDSLA